MGGWLAIKKKSIMQNEEGQTLLEVVFALTVSVIIIGAVTLSVITALKNIQEVKIHSLAVRYAQEGMEIMRKYRVINAASFRLLQNGIFSGTGKTYCLDNGQTVPVEAGLSGCSPNADGLKRAVNVQHNANSCVAITPATGVPSTPDYSTEVTVTVSWFSNDCARPEIFCHQTQSISCLADFPVSTP